MKKVVLAIVFVFTMAIPAAFADETDDRNKDWNVDVKLLEKLAKKKKCKEVIMYREVLPFFGKETTKQASREITVQFEKEDLAKGRAIILHEKSKCDELIGTFFVMCTTDTALCYFEKPKNIGKGKKLVTNKEKKNAKAKTKTAKAAKKDK